MTFLATILIMASATAETVAKPNLFPVALYYSTPPISETCKRIIPKHAANYDRELKYWRSRNSAYLERVMPVLAKQMESDGKSTLDHLREEALATAKEFEAYPPEKQQQACLTLYLYVGNH